MTKQPILTIGMAVVEDFKGLKETIQHIRSTNDRITDCEFVVINNKPESKKSSFMKSYIENDVHGYKNLGAYYIELDQPRGTSPPRNEVFKRAKGRFTMCMDSHIQTAVSAIDRTIEYFEKNWDTPHLYSGPIVYDNLVKAETHFDDVWREGMHGIWGTAWKCNCNLEGCTYFSVWQGEKDTPLFVSLTMNPQPVTVCKGCGKPFPTAEEVSYSQRHKALEHLGYTELGHHADEEPFEIPGQGLGLFTCRTNAWLGFNPNCRAFGGEELYIHDKYRKAGFKCINLPWLRWNHSFYKEDNEVPGVGYAAPFWDKVRNYILEWNELGKPLEPIYKHFVLGQGMSEKYKPQNTMIDSDWQYLITDPLRHSENPHTKKKTCSTCPNDAIPQPPKEITKVNEYLAWAKAAPRDLNAHFDKIAEIASTVTTVTEISGRRESTIPLLNCKGLLQSFNIEIDPLQDQLRRDFKPNKLQIQNMNVDQILEIAPTELLYLHTKGLAHKVYEALARFAPSVSRYIIIPYTKVFDEFGEGSTERVRTPGLLPGIRRFLSEKPQWSILYHSTEQMGMTLLGCLDSDKPKLPGLITMAANFSKAVASHVASGAKKVSLEVLTARLETCTMCPQRNNGNCSVCGCDLETKATWQTANCPLSLWKE